MKILQLVVSENQLDTMFYHGVIAEGKGYKLETYQDGEIFYKETMFVGAETVKLKDLGLTDDDIYYNRVTDILVKSLAGKLDNTSSPTLAGRICAIRSVYRPGIVIRLSKPFQTWNPSTIANIHRIVVDAVIQVRCYCG